MPWNGTMDRVGRHTKTEMSVRHPNKELKKPIGEFIKMVYLQILLHLHKIRSLILLPWIWASLSDFFLMKKVVEITQHNTAFYFFLRHASREPELQSWSRCAGKTTWRRHMRTDVQRPPTMPASSCLVLSQKQPPDEWAWVQVTCEALSPWAQ